jgi:hypothetical protein
MSNVMWRHRWTCVWPLLQGWITVQCIIRSFPAIPDGLPVGGFGSTGRLQSHMHIPQPLFQPFHRNLLEYRACQASEQLVCFLTLAGWVLTADGITSAISSLGFAFYM